MTKYKIMSKGLPQSLHVAELTIREDYEFLIL